MKKVFILVLALALAFSSFLASGCSNKQEEATTVITSDTKVTSAPIFSDTAETTTQVAETSAQTEIPPVATTLISGEAITPAETSADDTTTLPIFARFDFGTKTKAEDKGMTSHSYLTKALSYNASYIDVVYTEDSIIVYAKKNYTGSEDRTAFALCFEDIVSYDFEDKLVQGYGSWEGAPISRQNINNPDKWCGLHQFMKIRMKNNTPNNMISVHWHRAGEDYASTLLNTCMYLQGGAPRSADEHNLSTFPVPVWANYTYDMAFLAGVGRQIAMGKDGERPSSYFDACAQVRRNGHGFKNNWNTVNGNITGIQFHLLGAYGQVQEYMTDSRVNIHMGNKIEIDYIIFGSSIDQLNAYTSYWEDENI